MKSQPIKAILGTLIILAVIAADFMLLRRFPPIGRIGIIMVNVIIVYPVIVHCFTKKNTKK